jgi:polysaccharide biosynthesis protein PslG
MMDRRTFSTAVLACAAATLVSVGAMASPTPRPVPTRAPTPTPSSSRIPASFFGVHENHFFSQNEPWPAGPGGSRTIGSMRTWDMDSLNGWFQIETSRGVYTWTKLDKLIQAAQANGSDIIYTFGWTPRWAIGSARCQNSKLSYGGKGCSNPPANLTYWDEFVRAIATHAKGKIAAYEIWNEPNIRYHGVGVFWTGDVQTLLTMTRHAYNIIKAIDPAAKITTPSPAIGSCSKGQNKDASCWMNDFLNLGGGAYVDVISFHGYVSSATAFTTLANEMASVRNSHNLSSKPLWDTESSSGVIATPDYVGQFELLHVFSPVSRHYWYSWDNGSFGTMWSPSSGLNSGGVAYAQIYNWVVGSTPTQSSCTVSNNTYTCGLTLANGSPALAVWNSAGNATFTVPEQYGHYRDLSGNTVTISNNKVAIGPSAILLVP